MNGGDPTPVRILYLADIRFPLERANGIQTFETCWALADRGHTVTLAVRPDTHVPARDPFAFYGRPPHERLRIEYAPRRLLFGSTYVAQGFRAAAHLSPLLRRAGYIADAIARAARARAVDLVLTRDLGVASALLRLPRGLRPPVVYESHGYAPEVSRALPGLVSGAPAPSAAKLRRLGRRERHVWLRADGYVTITAALANELGHHFGAREHLAVVPDGVRLPPDRRYVPPPDRTRPLVAYAGHLYPWKGVDILIEALARLPHVDAVIVGGHSQERDLQRVQALAGRHALGSRITFTGLLPPPEVAAQLARAHVLALPNTATGMSERYTSPLKLFEYLAAGRAIVASDLPAIREVVRHGEQAWLVPPGDAAALAAALDHLVSHPAIAAPMAERAFAHAAEFSWARRAARLEALAGQLHGIR
jgi:glycosyltransferase involved in cell wall biosynthesis